MSDDISIPRPALSGSVPGRTSFTHSYRSRRAGMDTGTKRLVLAASGLGVVLLGGMAVWSFGGASSPNVGVPRIEADNRPMRVKPENPGGMTAIGVGDSTAIGGGNTDLAPVAEQPDPQALLAQRRAAAPPKISATPPAAPPSPTASAATLVAPPPVAPPPVATAAVAAPAVAAPAVATPAVAAPGGPLIQLAALESEAGATAEWQRLSRKLPDLLGSHRPVVQQTELGGKKLWRLRTGGFTDIADATQFCKRLRDKGIGCSLANF